MKNKIKIKEGALDVGIQSYQTSDGSSTSQSSISNTGSKSTSGFKKNSRVYTNPQNLKKTLDSLKDKDVDVVITNEEKGATPMTLEYVSEVMDESTGEYSKPFTIKGKNYQIVRAMSPDKKVTMGVYAFDEQDESGNCKIYGIDEFEKIAKSAINELGVQEPEGPEAATLNPVPENKDSKQSKKEKNNTSFEGFKHFIVNEKAGKVRKFKTIQELAKAQMSEEETYMGIKEFKKFIDSALFGKRKMKETTDEQEVVPTNIINSVQKTMDLIKTKLTPSIIDKVKQNPIAQEQMILFFSKEIGVPASRLSQLINGIKGLAQEVKSSQNPVTGQQQVTERKIIKVKDLK